MIEKLFEVKKIIHKLNAFIVLHLRFVLFILPFHDLEIAIQADCTLLVLIFFPSKIPPKIRTQLHDFLISSNNPIFDPKTYLGFNYARFFEEIEQLLEHSH